LSVTGFRRLRRLRPDGELFRRRAAGETLRSIAPDYGVEHSTLSRYFRRPAARAEVERAARLLRAERREAERVERERGSAARRSASLARQRQPARPSGPTQPPAMVPAAAAPGPSATPMRNTLPRRDPYQDWLDSHDNRRAFSRADLRSRSDDRAAAAVAAGGGMEAMIAATGLRSLDNVERLIDPAIVAEARHHDAVQVTANQLGLDAEPA